MMQSGACGQEKKALNQSDKVKISYSHEDNMFIANWPGPIP